MQEAIVHLENTLSVEQVGSLIDRLNRPGDARLPAMWELAALYGASKAGKLKHEVELPTGRRPDIELSAPCRGFEGNISIVSDVITISDAGLHDNNPIEMFASKFHDVIVKNGLNPTHFNYHVRGEQDGEYGDSRIQLRIPSKKNLDSFLKENVIPWIKELALDPSRPGGLEKTSGRLFIILSYMPGAQWGGGGYTSFTVAASRDKNPLFNGLRSKRAQLKGAPSDTLRLIIACDGGCDLMHSRQAGPGTYTATQVAKDFLRQNNSIDAVLLIWVQTDLEFMTSRSKYTLFANLVLPNDRNQSPRLTTAAVDALDQVCRKIHHELPQPVKTPANVARQSRVLGLDSDKLGANAWNGNMVKISSRALQRLLAGKLTAEEFQRAHGWADRGRSSPFATAMMDGRLFSSVSVEPMPDGDDDWLIFEFGSPDPAAAPFRRSDRREAEKTSESVRQSEISKLSGD